MEDILDSRRIIDVSGLGPRTLGERWALGADLICMTSTVWERAVEPAGTDKRFVPNRLSSLCAYVVGHLEPFKTEGSLQGVLAATPFTIALDSYDEDCGEYYAGGLENTEEFPYPAALKTELFVYHTVRRRPVIGVARPLVLLITMNGESVPEFPPVRADEIRAALDEFPEKSTEAEGPGVA